MWTESAAFFCVMSSLFLLSCSVGFMLDFLFPLYLWIFIWSGSQLKTGRNQRSDVPLKQIISPSLSDRFWPWMLLEPTAVALESTRRLIDVLVLSPVSKAAVEIPKQHETAWLGQEEIMWAHFSVALWGKISQDTSFKHCFPPLQGWQQAWHSYSLELNSYIRI